MSIDLKNNVAKSAIFQNTVEDFEAFTGQILSSNQLKEFDFSHLNVAIIGTDQEIRNAFRKNLPTGKICNCISNYASLYFTSQSNRYTSINYPSTYCQEPEVI